MAVKKNVDVFVEWAKSRLDEMSADATTLDANLAELDLMCAPRANRRSSR